MLSTVHEAKLPDRSGTIAVVQEAEGQYVFVLGERFGPYDGVAVETVKPSEDGRHVAWAATTDGSFRLYVDGEARGERWDGFGEVRWVGSRHVVFAAERNGGWHVVTPTGPSERYDSIAAGSLVSDRDGSSHGFIGIDKAGAHVVVDGVASGPFQGAGALGIDEEGAHVAFVSLEKNGSFVHIDRERYGPYRDVATLALSPRLGRFAASVLTEEGWRALVDGNSSDPCDTIGAFTFTRDGTRVAWAASKAGQWTVHRDAAVLGPYDAVDHSALRFSADGRLAFGAKFGGAARVIEDGQAVGDTFDRVELVTWAGEAPVLGFAGVRDNQASVVVGGETRGRYDAVTDLALDAKGQSWIAAAELSGASLLVTDGVPRAFDGVAAGSLTFDERGEHWGALVGDASDRSLHFIVDGARASRLAFDEIASFVQVDRGPPDDARLSATMRAWVRAEIARHGRR